MEEIIAGWAAGYVMGIVATFAMVYLLRPGGSLYRLREAAFADVSAVLFAVPLFMGATLMSSMLGVVIGVIYLMGDFAARPGGAGSPALAFTFAVCLVAIMPLPALVVLAREEWKAWVSIAVAFAIAFGWAMPVLASL